MARKDKKSDDWYVGGVNADDPRDFTLNLDFLDPGKCYEATIYADTDDAHYLTNPEAYQITRRKASDSSVIKLHMAPGGGFAISLKEI